VASGGEGGELFEVACGQWAAAVIPSGEVR
jgi:hypothetical protein